MVFPILICAARAIPILLVQGVPVDTARTFLPLARMLMSEPEQLWRSADLLKTGIGIYAYMALLGADMVAIKTTNLVLSLCALVLIFDIARRIGGLRAAGAAAWLYAVSPELFFWTVYPMGEPLFLFMVTLWFWSCTYLTCSESLPKSKAICIVVVAAWALSSATLTRGTYMYWIPVFGLSAFVVALIPRWRGNSLTIRIAAVHLLALILVGAYMLKNQSDFGRPLIATGAGNALYYGNNPMFHGEEPPLFGISYDAFYVMGRHDHLSIEGDEKEADAFKQIIASTPTSTLASMYLHKAGALLFFSTTHLKNYGERAWRVLLLVLAFLGFWVHRKNTMAWMLLGTAAYQWAVHLPVLYNPRYTIAALDLQLTLLAGLWLGHSLQMNRVRIHITWLLTAALAIVLGALHQRFSHKLMPDLSSVQPTVQSTATASELSWSGLNTSPFGQPARSPTGDFVILWDSTTLQSGELSFVGLEISKLSRECKKVWIRLSKPDGRNRETSISLRGFKEGRDFHWGLTNIDLPEPGGSLRMAFECKPDIEVKFGELGIYNASVGHKFRDRSVFP